MQMDPSHRKDKIKPHVAVHCTMYNCTATTLIEVAYFTFGRLGKVFFLFFYEEVKSIVLLNPDTFNHSMIINLF